MLFVWLLLIFPLLFHPAEAAETDTRNIATGSEIPSEGYCDQPYIVVNADGSWTCVMTTAGAHEGSEGQHIVSIRSTDRGATWSAPIPIEPSDGPEASWAQPLIVPSGRIYVFYTYNIDNIREVRADTDYARKRVDTLGAYVFKYSEDGGATWSRKRHRIPVREMAIDRENPYGGEVRFFWGVGKPIEHQGTVYIGFSKVGRFGEGFIARSQGCFLRSENILTEPDPEKIRWETLPAGDTGLVAPSGPISEETSIVGLSDGSLYCTYRTVDGHPCHAYSRDGGRTWSDTSWMTYTPGGRQLKQPRAANFVWRTSNGTFLYWFHNHGGKSYDNRNPAWICGGIEKDGFIHWSQPEILLYDDNIGNRMSYPDFIEQDGRYYITETQKTTARVHEIDPALLRGITRDPASAGIASDGLVTELAGEGCQPGTEITMPRLPLLRNPRSGERGGFAIDCGVRFDDLSAGQVVFDSRDESGKGISLITTARQTLKITLCGTLLKLPGGASEGLGLAESSWECDTGLLQTGMPHHITIIADGGPGIISFVVDGVLCDGGETRTCGWGRIHPDLCDINGAKTAVLAPSLRGDVSCFRLYDRYLRTFEAVGNRGEAP